MEPFENDPSHAGPNEPPSADEPASNENADVEAQDPRVDDEPVEAGHDDDYADEIDGEPDAHETDDDEVDREDTPRHDARPAADARATKAYDFLVRILDEMGLDVTVERRPPRPESSADEINLEMLGRDVGRVIGKKGQVLAALQYLVNRVANRPGLPRRHVVLDAEGYRYRRETSLASMARKLGEQAVKEGKIITFDPMSPRDRRVVHLALAKFPNVVTKSDGEGDERRVRIIPVRR